MGLMHQIHVFQRLIDLRGQKLLVYRATTNQFGEDSGVELVDELCGLFHEANSYLGVSLAEAGKIYADKKPMVLFPYTDVIKKHDIFEICGSRFRVTGIDDLGNMHLFLDVSLEVAP